MHSLVSDCYLFLWQSELHYLKRSLFSSPGQPSERVSEHTVVPSLIVVCIYVSKNLRILRVPGFTEITKLPT